MDHLPRQTSLAILRHHPNSHNFPIYISKFYFLMCACFDLKKPVWPFFCSLSIPTAVDNRRNLGI